MKILIFSDCQSDYLSYMTHHGFAELYGGFNVITYPFKKTHHGQIDDKCYLDDGKCGINIPGESTEPIEGKEFTANEILPLIINGEIELSIIQSSRTHSVCAARQMLWWIRKFKTPLIYIDGEDGIDIKLDLINEFKPLLSFKRELLPKNKTDIMLPLPFSCSIDTNKYKDNPNKDIDVFFSIGLTDNRRVDVLNELRTIKNKNIVLHPCDKDNISRLSYGEYVDCLSRSKINIICRGHGMDTVRRFEAGAFSGAMLADKLPIITPDDFVDSESILYYNNDASDIITKINYLMENDSIRKSIGMEGRRHSQKHHTTKARAEYLINKVKEAL